MSALREQFIQQMQLKGYSPRSIKTYVESLIHLSKFYQAGPDSLSQQQIRDYLQRCAIEKNFSTSFINQCIGAVKILFVQVLKREWDPISIPRMKREKKLPVVLSKQEVASIFEGIKNIRHKTILMVTYSAGLRVSETRNLRINDIDSKRMQIRVRQAKGAKDRYVILSAVVLDQLRIYYKTYRPKEWLFASQQSEKISEKMIQHVFKTAIKRAGIIKKVSIHSLRHSFATHLMEQGVSLPIIQQLLGHRSLRTTSVYLHVQQYAVDLVKSPLDSLSI